MDALIGLGKTEKDFNWISDPKIYRLNKETLDLCIKTLKGKRKFLSIFNIYETFLYDADYIAFSEDELSEYMLKYPDIFLFEGDRSFPRFLEIKLKK